MYCTVIQTTLNVENKLKWVSRQNTNIKILQFLTDLIEPPSIRCRYAVNAGNQVNECQDKMPA